MSSVYILAPPTWGKVLLHTTCGDLEIELWAKETPKACRNFVQLSMEGYYDNCPINRIVKDFIVQTGDPTGQGGQGESIYGKPFPNEIHSRLRFNQRGIVAMVHGGTKMNSSEFFITTGANAEHLNGKNTIFGKVVGDTVYNLTRINDFETDGEGRPLVPVKITSVEIIANPFDDIVPRNNLLSKRKQAAQQAKEAKKQKRARVAKKDLGLLSFGDDEEDVDEEIVQKLNKGSKKTEKKKVVKKVLSAPTPEPANEESPKPEGASHLQQNLMEQIKKKQQAFDQPITKEPSTTKSESDAYDLPKKKANSKRQAIRELEKERMKYKKKQSSKSERQEKALKALNAFNQTLRSQPKGEEAETAGQEEGPELMYDKDYDQEEQDVDVKNPSWMAHRLKFNAPIRDPQLDDYTVIDPLNDPKSKTKK